MCSVTSFEEKKSQQNIEDVMPQTFTSEDSIDNITIDVNPYSSPSQDLMRNKVDHAPFASCSSTHVIMEDVLPYDTCCSSSTEYNHGQCGLSNLGNTCFMNSILQCLNNIPRIVQYYISSKENSSLSNSTTPVSAAFVNLIESMRISSTVRPVALKSAITRYAPLFSGYSQQDAHEYLTVLLDALHQESCVQTEDGEERSIITVLFQGQMKYTIKCSEASRCQNITITTDAFLDMPVFIERTMSSSSSAEVINVIPDEKTRRDSSTSLHIWSHIINILCLPWILLKKCRKLLKNVFGNLCWLGYYIVMRMWYFCMPGWKRGLAGNFYQRVVTSTTEKVPQTCSSELLEQCLINNIFVVERMSPNSTWFCPNCHRNRQLTKENHILSLPQVLIIHLKRFNMESSSRTKIETFVKYPLELNMNKFLSSVTSDEEPHIYDLIGVCLHSGSFERGHYTAYVKKPSGWFCFNDSFVSSISVQDIVDRNAYILFYLRRVYI